jgi:hypothetical protein
MSLSLLGNGKDAAAHTALRERASRPPGKMPPIWGAPKLPRRARGDALVNVGYAYSTSGQTAKGIALMERVAKATQARRRGASATWAGTVAGRSQGRRRESLRRRAGQRRLGNVGPSMVGIRAQPSRQGVRGAVLSNDRLCHRPQGWHDAALL